MTAFGASRVLSLPRYRLTFPRTGINPSGFCYWEGEAPTGQVIRAARGHHLHDEDLARVFLASIPSQLADLVDVALAVYIADRLSLRRPPGYPLSKGGWQRHIEIQVPVRNSALWTRSDVRSGLEGLLHFLTDDQWSFDFYEREGPYRAFESQTVLFSLPFDRQPVVCSFSGGLDVLAGAAGQLLHARDSHLICVSGATNDWIGSVQSDLVRGLAKRFGDRVTRLPISYQLASAVDSTWPDEPTQRSRGFLHLMFGAVSAILAGVSSLTVHENGVGAINLPYTAAQFGAQMTRAMHPLTLADASNWLSLYLARPFQVIGSALGMTKAQICQSLAEADLEDLMRLSFSCDGFQQVAGQPQCGTCTSCLLRRQSLFASGLDRFDDPKRYRFDVTDPTVLLPPDRSRWLYLMLDQIATLRECLEASDPWQELVAAFPLLHEIESRADDWQQVGGPNLPSVTLPSLYRTYLREWDQFPVRAQPTNCYLATSAA